MTSYSCSRWSEKADQGFAPTFRGWGSDILRDFLFGDKLLKIIIFGYQLSKRNCFTYFEQFFLIFIKSFVEIDAFAFLNFGIYH